MDKIFAMFSYAPLSVSILLVVCIVCIGLIVLVFLPMIKDKEELEKKFREQEFELSELKEELDRIRNIPVSGDMEEFKADMLLQMQKLIRTVRQNDSDRKLEELLDVTNSISINMRSFAEMLAKFATSSSIAQELLSTASTIHVKVSMIHALMRNECNEQQASSRDVK